MNKIPSVNLADFLSNDISKKQQFIDDIGHAYENIGFIALKGHFLDDVLVDELYEQIKGFFELPVDVKRKYEVPGIGGQRGYVSFGKESAKGKKEGDLKEFWHFGQDLNTKSYLKNRYPENIIVKELEGFNKIGNLVSFNGVFGFPKLCAISVDAKVVVISVVLVCFDFKIII